MPAIPTSRFTAVYGPVSSWRYGRSLGIDPIGCVSTCSFNCVYCQLGEIEHKTSTRAIYVPTQQILKELQVFAPWDVDTITLSGSGEPTLALNLGEMLQGIHELTGQSTLVLTNGTLLNMPDVRAALTLADKVSVKLDTISPDTFWRINRPVPELNLSDIWAGIQQFRAEFSGEMSIQTMLLFSWDAQSKAEYIRLMQLFAPDEIQLNTPTRPKPLKHQLEGRGNHSSAPLPYEVLSLKCVTANVLREFAMEIHNATGIPVRCAPSD